MDRFKKAKIASILGIVGNIFLLIIKGSIGFVTNSQAMIGDFFNSAGDVLSSILTYVGNKIASKPSDDDHDLGHGKAEYIYSMLISIAMFLMASKVIVDSIKSLFIKNNYHFSKWLIVVCIVTIVVKFILYLYTSNVSKKYKNLLIEANSKDHRNDCIITSFNLLSAILSYFGIGFIDGVVGSMLGFWILITAIKIFIESYDVLMDKTISKETKDEVLKIIDKYKEIKKFNHFNATPVGYKYQISLTIFVDGKISTFDSHRIADDLEKDIIKNIPEIYLAVIHVNPIDINKESD
ncbi:MAG: cation transporter [Firmicutes bacterium]|nr:cation transporter [Bacillota bacterium]